MIYDATPHGKHTRAKKPGLFKRAGIWARSHVLDITVITLLLSLAGAVAAVNFMNYPMRFEDEGTYISQAWAVQHWGELAHYTYWYDHPPLAWLQIALYTTVTFAFERYDSAISAGREFMLVLHLISVALVYAIARRLAMGKALAFVAAGLFAFSPLAVEYSRYILLDNIGLPWMLGAFLLALSPRKHLAAVIGSAACMAVAVLSKETLLIFLPALLYMLYQNSDTRNRRYAFTIFGVLFSLMGAFYVLFAALKGELFPGQDHVSLVGSTMWQLFERPGNGSIFDAANGGTDANRLVRFWLTTDPWLLLGGIVLTPLAFIRRHFRPIALAMLIGVLMMLRGGYLPYPYVIALLPFAALVIAATLYTFIVSPMISAQRGKWHTVKRQAAESASVLVAIAFIVFVAPAWHAGLQKATTQDAEDPSRQTVAWVEKNIPRDQRLVVESALWVDIYTQGFEEKRPVWLYKTETDPEIVEEIGGWQNIDYLVLNGITLDESRRVDFPTVFTAKDNAEVVAEFGVDEHKVVIMKVKP